jgi:SAM-dependent methyltransferase
VQTHLAEDWFVGFNTGLKAKFWRAASEPWADEEAGAIAALLDLPAAARVLDAPSGAGRIALRLAERALRVTGIDISEEEVAEARRLAAERGLAVRFEQGDVRSLPEQRFDAVVHWGNSFGYLPHHGTVEHVGSMRRALRHGGRLVLESMTVAESLLPEFRSELEYEAGGVTLRARHEYDARHSRLLGQFEFRDSQGRIESGPVIHHVYTVAEIVRLLEAAGFEVDELLGDPLARSAYSVGAPRLVVLATALESGKNACKRI